MRPAGQSISESSRVLGAQVVSAHDGDIRWGTVQTTRALGLLLTAVVAVRVVLRRPLRDGRIWGTLAGLPLLATGLSGETWVVATTAFIGGLGFTVATITWESALQTAVGEESLSRIAAYDDLFSYLAIPPITASRGATCPAVWRAEGQRRLWNHLHHSLPASPAQPRCPQRVKHRDAVCSGSRARCWRWVVPAT